MNQTEKDMRKEAREAIIECLKNGYEGYYCDLHNEVFNTNYYIIGTYAAKKHLEEYGVFDAIEKVQDYENNYLGERYTDVSNPKKLVNMLYYVIGEEELYDMMDEVSAFHDNWNNKASNETNSKIMERSMDIKDAKDITKDIKTFIKKMERLGKENNYTLYAEDEKIVEAQKILNNIFKL